MIPKYHRLKKGATTVTDITVIGGIITVTLASMALIIFIFFIPHPYKPGESDDDCHAINEAEYFNAIQGIWHFGQKEHPTTFEEFARDFSEAHPRSMSREEAATFIESNNARTPDYKLFVTYSKGSDIPVITNKHIDSLIGNP